MRYIVLLLLICNTSLAVTIETSDSKMAIRPFGYIAPRPPPTDCVIQVTEKIEFKANQVCGYTDWTSAVVNLPKKLLSLDYWRDIATNLVDDALNTALAVSGALPSMLACTASPTFCSLLNKAEGLAQANLKFTFDTCEILESLSDFTKSQFNSLSNCVKNKVKKGIDKSVAIDQCAIASGSDRSETNEENLIYDPSSLSHKVCQLNTRQHSGISEKKGTIYTVSETVCKWSESLGGIKIEAGVKTHVGGTHQKGESPVESKYEDELEKTTNFLIDLVELMHQIRFGRKPYDEKGPQPREKVISHQDVQKKLKMSSDGKILTSGKDNESVKLPPIYRVTSSHSPALMISPATLYELVDTIPSNRSPKKMYSEGSMSQIALALEPLIQSTAFANTQDLTHKWLSLVRESCTHADMQSVAAQDDCQYRMKKIKESIRNLEKRYDTDLKHLSAQARFYAEVDKIKQGRIHVYKRPESAGPDEILSPLDLMK